MKNEILQILEMQAEGKLTRDQAAELLAALADQAREKDDACQPAGAHASSEGAPGPRGENSKKAPAGAAAGATAAIHDMIDAAIGMGATVGRAASVWGGEFLNMVHRDEGGNSVTLSRVGRPAGDAFHFRGNSFNVSSATHMELQQAEVCNNTFNGSKLAHLKINRGRFSQCAISGSSLSHVTIEGPAGDAIVLPESEGQPGGTGIRAATFNATKFGRVSLTGLSRIDAGTFQAASVRDLQLADSTLKDVRVNDANLFFTTVERSRLLSTSFDRVNAQEVKIHDASFDRVSFHGLRLHAIAITGGTWNNTHFRGVNGANHVQDATFDHCTLNNVTFEGCTFRRTALRNLKLSDVTVRNIDFTGMTLETEEAFRRAAGI